MIKELATPIIISHRGVTNLGAQENTIESFNQAIAGGADYVETDIRRTKDGYLVCFHDKKWNKVPVGALTYKEWIMQTGLLGWTPPLLEDVLDACRGKIRLNLEVKEPGLEEDIIKTASGRFPLKHLLISSFNDEILVRVKEIDSHVPTGLLLGKNVFQHRFRLTAYQQDIFPERRLIKTKADIVCPNYRVLRLNFLKRMHALQKPVYVWTVNHPKRMVDLVDKGADGLITDQVKLAGELFGKKEIAEDKGKTS
ncbi:glycerophosphodiester phosphodiesterase [Thalassorhabdus alkalitolerans]|uniref:Glycerophosphodiester phosphodiesterase n=1 Tax=Thalassorhabdus alkalitolerans TaxID=2282697 RepID=A0ABW0YMN8_9BACI